VIDRVTRRSALASLILHGVLVVAALVALGPPPPLPPPDRAPDTVPAPDAAPRAADLPPLLVAQSAAQPLSAPRLPDLTPGVNLLPPLPIIRPTATERPGDQRSRGRAGADRAPVDLPATDAESPTLRALRGMTTNPRLSHDQDMQATAQWHIENRIVRAYRSTWRSYTTQVSNRQLVIWVVADEHRRVLRGGLFQCSTGAPDLDRAIEGLLRQKDFVLPPIVPGVTTYFLVTLP